MPKLSIHHAALNATKIADMDHHSGAEFATATVLHTQPARLVPISSIIARHPNTTPSLPRDVSLADSLSSLANQETRRSLPQAVTVPLFFSPRAEAKPEVIAMSRARSSPQLVTRQPRSSSLPVFGLPSHIVDAGRCHQLQAASDSLMARSRSEGAVQ